MKDLVVKRVGLHDTEITFQPVINEQSKQLLPQNRPKIWERELPKKQKFQKSIDFAQTTHFNNFTDFNQEAKNDYFTVGAPSNDANLANFQGLLRQKDQFNAAAI